MTRDPYTTSEFAALPPLEAAPTRTLRLSLAVVRVLTYYNRLTNVTSLIAIWWGVWTIALPSFWDKWPVATTVSERMFGHPHWLSWTLLIAGSLDWLACRYDWRYVRYTTAIVELACWSLLTYVFTAITPVYAPAAAVYSAFAFLKLMAWTSIYVGIDRGKLPVYKGCGNVG